MKLERLTVHNFRSFAGTHKLRLARPAGLYFVAGRNAANSRLGANGAGKSTIWDAVYWCLYGKTLRGIRGGGVRSWYCDKGDAVWVAVKLRLGKRRLVVRRDAPRSISVRENGSWTVYDQDGLDSLTGLSESEFATGVIVGQWAEMFTDLRPADRLQLFTDILDLGKWIGYSDRAKERSQELLSRTDRMCVEIDSGQSAFEQCAQDLKHHQLQADEYEHAREQVFGSLSMQREECLVERRFIERAATRISARRESIESVIESLAQERRQLAARSAFIQSMVSDAEYDVRRVDDEIASIDSSLKLHDRGGRCPRCGTLLSAGARTRLERRRRRLLRVRQQRLSLLDYLRTDFGEIGRSLSDLHTDISNDEADLLKIDNYRQRCRASLRESAIRLEQIDRRLEECESTTNPHLDACNRLEKRLVDLRKRLKRLRFDRAQLTRTADASQFWVDGFKHIRLQLIDRALDALQVRVNNHLVELGLIGWSVEFMVERETASGTVARGFQIEIQSPDSSKSVAFENWSGGESQRLRLAVTMSLVDLINDARGWVNFEVWDEPTRFLGQEGIDDLVHDLTIRAEQTGKCVYLTDHHSLDFGWFSGTIEVVKDEDGSRLMEVVDG